MYLNLVYEHFHESSYIPLLNIAVSDITSSTYRENKIILLYFDSSVLFETTKPFCVPLNERKCRQRFIIQEGKVHT